MVALLARLAFLGLAAAKGEAFFSTDFLVTVFLAAVFLAADFFTTAFLTARFLGAAFETPDPLRVR
ncbi:hypothetical protein EV05_1983 [Prochlorococcus sp. MIT 0601]|nr:hypothetical protein EV05_1983 [Prochlorococcus sp. MIT 0601]